ncbi:amidoligase family protein [Desulfobotulus sp. H1]|uniref:Amidoligase family protein n=1 Tax=Desulfobotulus pelophilus TaxID=2823377 RepID=A0ABT3N8H3_9BACT|nr:amidoligase family protein [Desulfobotulus pelophilus]MCW7753758.1 amidoligase family protein [Desulfobotulus pelophilus]
MKTLTPPISRTAKGHLRKVGVEIELAGMASLDAARIVAQVFDGIPARVSAHRAEVTRTKWGTFRVELDTQYAHPEKKGGAGPEGEPGSVSISLETKAREWIGDVAMAVVPTEITCPPVPWDELHQLDRLVKALRDAGAKGTGDSVFYGFGLHLNPEVPDFSLRSICNHMKAYLLLSDWLREKSMRDSTREILPHANPFPESYRKKVLHPGYYPELNRMIADYILDNPSRNRELDCYPLFAHLCPDYPHEIFRSRLIRPRPAFHYRLPDANLSDPEWRIVREWQRWLLVEHLAADEKKLARISSEYLQRASSGRMDRWMEHFRTWMRDL